MEMVFSTDNVLDVLKHEDGQYYTLQMREGGDVMVSIDHMLEMLIAKGEIVPKANPTRAVYNGKPYENEWDIKTEITNSDVFSLLNSGAVKYTTIEPETSDYKKAVQDFQKDIDNIIKHTT